jgi:hypothetical protein
MTKDNKCLDTEKEKLIKIHYFKNYFSGKFNDNENQIVLDYNSEIIEYLISYLNDNNINLINKENILEYVDLLNFIGFDEAIQNVINKFDDYKKDIGYILEMYNMYPNYISIIQKKISEFYFDYDDLIELEESCKISNTDLYFNIESNEKNIKNISGPLT